MSPMNPRLLRPRAANNQFLLDTHRNAVAAFSLRRLWSGYGGPVVRVRTSAAGNDERDFSAGEVENGTLADWVGAGNTGSVRTWYDQSGNSNHAQQTTATNQPLIVDAGTLVSDVGKAALDARTVSSNRKFMDISSVSAASVFGVARRNGTLGIIHYLFGGTNRGIFFGGSAVLGSVGVLSSGTTITRGNANTTDRQVFAVLTDASTDTVWANGVSTTGSVTALAEMSRIGDRVDTNVPFNGLIQELIVYNRDMLSFQNAISSSMNLYYSVY